jgi:hypothetical protein
MGRAATPAIALLLIAAGVGAALAQPPERRNWFDDPFERATGGLSGCPAPEGPLLTQDEQRREAHHRIERGTSCWLAGQCDEPNAYKHDPEINAAAAAALRSDRRLSDTRLWVTTQRKFVFVQGCVRNRAQVRQVERDVRTDPRVEYVGVDVLVGTRGRPPYRTAAPSGASDGPRGR